MKTLKAWLGRPIGSPEWYELETNPVFDWDKHEGFMRKNRDEQDIMEFCHKKFSELTGIKLDKGECRQVIIKIGLVNDIQKNKR